MELICLPRLLSQLNEKEREYQELLRSSVCRKQEQIDALRTAAAATEGEMFIKCFHTFLWRSQKKAPLYSTFIHALHQRVRSRNVRKHGPCRFFFSWL